MKNAFFYTSALLLALSICSGFDAGKKAIPNNATLFRNVTLIDGDGGVPVEHTDILVQGDTIAAIAPNQQIAGAAIVDLKGKTIMPALISTHVHVGLIKGTANRAANYTRENILSQLKKYEAYGVCSVLAMGSDRPLLFEKGLRDSSVNGLLPGARLYSAAYGFGVPNGAPPVEMGLDNVFRPVNPYEVRAEIWALHELNPTLVKLWDDDFNGKYVKMRPEICQEIIKWSHNYNLRVAAHVYYLSDARRLVAEGVNILGHSIRDSIIDDALIQQMKARHVAYIPTLSLDEFAYIYVRKADWINDPYFKASLEPGVYEMITSEKYQNDLKSSSAYVRNVAAFETALKNLKKLYDAGILVSLGTDSGAIPIRAQGFSEHIELELMVQAGLTPLQAITVATKNASEMLQISNRYGTLQKGKVADFIVLNGNPANDIKNTRKIESVFKAGKLVSNGPFSK
jgi:imidazolonepropionase-like amidohydrolase